MTDINAFYRNTNAVQYMDQLFGSRQTTSAGAGFFQKNSSATGAFAGNEAAERALARIVEILTLGGDQGESPDVSESMGYVTSATGTEGDDTMTLTGRGISGIDARAGDDKITAKSDAITDIAAGDGKDVLKLSGSFISGIDGGAGGDDIGVIGKLALDIEGGDGDDVVKIAADTIIGASGGDGNDSMTLEGNRIFASGGRGDDTITIRQKGTDAYAEYAFAIGDGRDAINTDGPLSIRLSGVQESDLSITRDGDTLTASIKGSDDKITVTLDTGADATYSFVNDKGGLILKVG